MLEGWHGTARARARIVGPFEIRDLDGRDMTPRRSSKAQGLLMLLLLAPGQERSREYLIDKLWSDRQPEQGARSLKTELHVIRTAFQEHRELLASDGGMVRLVPNSILRDIDMPDFEPELGRDIFEGCRVRDPEFSDWLEEQRRALSRALQAPALPTIWLQNTAKDAPFHQSVLAGGLSQSLADWCAHQIIKSGGDSPDYAADTPDTADFVLRNLSADGQQSVATQLEMRRSKERHSLWQVTGSLPKEPDRLIEGEDLHRLINTGVDRAIFEIAPPGGTSKEAAYLERGALGAVRLIFRNSGDDLELARKQLATNFDAQARGLYLAWSAYVLAFYKGERRMPDIDLKDEAEHLCRTALELEPHNSMVLALVSYAHTYLLNAPEFGLDLAHRAIRANRSNPLAWSFKSAALYWLGQTEAAYEAAMFARRISGNGPYRYAVETYCCVAATMANRVEDAIQAGEAAYRLKPDFLASQRYLALLYAHRKDYDKLRIVTERLRRSEPDFSLRKIIETSGYPSEILRTAPIAGDIWRTG